MLSAARVTHIKIRRYSHRFAAPLLDLQMDECIQKFVTYLGVSGALIEQASKGEIAEVARVLARHVAHYRQRYGDVSNEESLEMLRIEKISDEQAKILADGFGVLVEVLKALATPEGEH